MWLVVTKHFKITFDANRSRSSRPKHLLIRQSTLRFFSIHVSSNGNGLEHKKKTTLVRFGCKGDSYSSNS
jgi:hypothetical protein